MSQKTKIREDDHGPYVRTNGSIYRPVPTTDTVFRFRITSHTRFLRGEMVRVSHISHTPMCRVWTDGTAYRERWSSHGMYRNVPSIECWRPS